MYGENTGGGYGTAGRVVSAGSSGIGALGEHRGAGTGVRGASVNGRGGVFSGAKAAVQLLASGAATHPRSGLRGDLVVDSSGRLWCCRGATSWKQLA